MSAVTARLAPVRTGPRVDTAPARPRLRIVAHTAPDGARVPYFALCAAILIAALLGALGLNTSMAATSYEIRDRTRELAQVQQHRETLATQVEEASSPAQVMQRAGRLGLVPSEGVIYIDLASGTLVGAVGE